MFMAVPLALVYLWWDLMAEYLKMRVADARERGNMGRGRQGMKGAGLPSSHSSPPCNDRLPLTMATL